METKHNLPDSFNKLPDTGSVRYPTSPVFDLKETNKNPIIHYGQVSRQELDKLLTLVEIQQKQIDNLNKIVETLSKLIK